MTEYVNKASAIDVQNVHARAPLEVVTQTRQA